MHSNVGNGSVFGLHDLQRELLSLLPEATLSVGEATLELASLPNDAPRLISATVLEGSTLEARRVDDPPVSGFRAFLDGTQRSVVATYIGGAPIVWGHVAAVVRERHNRRMQTWGAALRETRIYAPRAVLPSVTWNTLAARYDDRLIDTTESGIEGGLHPFALRDAALHRVQAHREVAEQRLAELWCASERDPLFIDGGISGSERVAVSAHTVGVVKSHRTLYAEDAALSAVLALDLGERSSVFRVTSPRRTTVASWYLRLRDPKGHDPMWGLLRVEVANPPGEMLHRIGERADLVSRWILAEANPLALPDGRWDKMVYGVRDCEEFLRAVS
ncbi:MAG: hypothetical protein ABIY52_08750 [Gemmatimonadaceae bacterium]